MSFLRGRAEEEHRRQIRKMFDKADKENINWNNIKYLELQVKVFRTPLDKIIFFENPSKHFVIIINDSCLIFAFLLIILINCSDFQASQC